MRESRMNSNDQDTTLVALDFDGVINAVYPPSPDDYEVTALDFEHDGEVYAMTIHYKPDVVEFFNSLNRRDGVTVKWLTTWAHHTDQFKKLGFDTFEAILPTDYHQENTNVRHGVRWKSDSLAEHLSSNDYRRVIWIDDDLHYRYYLPEEYTDQDDRRGFWVVPATFLAVTQKDIDEIESIFNGTHWMLQDWSEGGFDPVDNDF